MQINLSTENRTSPLARFLSTVLLMDRSHSRTHLEAAENADVQITVNGRSLAPDVFINAFAGRCARDEDELRARITVLEAELAQARPARQEMPRDIVEEDDELVVVTANPRRVVANSFGIHANPQYIAAGIGSGIQRLIVGAARDNVEQALTPAPAPAQIIPQLVDTPTGVGITFTDRFTDEPAAEDPAVPVVTLNVVGNPGVAAQAPAGTTTVTFTTGRAFCVASADGALYCVFTEAGMNELLRQTNSAFSIVMEILRSKQELVPSAFVEVLRLNKIHTTIRALLTSGVLP